MLYENAFYNHLFQVLLCCAEESNYLKESNSLKKFNTLLITTLYVALVLLNNFLFHYLKNLMIFRVVRVNN